MVTDTTAMSRRLFYQLLRLAGENGVAAYGVIMYAAFLFVAVYVGYAVGSAPIVSFHYGARNHAEVHNLYQKYRMFTRDMDRLVISSEEPLMQASRRTPPRNSVLHRCRRLELLWLRK